MESRRDFLKHAAILGGAAAGIGRLPESIARAVAIDPALGSTFLDADHIVILMQENRSFDHALGSLQGVRGYNDPRAHLQPNGRPVWLQTDANGETFAPFRLDIKETNATWIGGLAHSWTDQADAHSNGEYNKWLIAKPSGHKNMPLTLGHYTRADLPFYYSFADAFTVCDQHFCSVLTGTTPNRLYHWSGTSRVAQNPQAKPIVYNDEADYGNWASYTTFPERLETAGISWKIYQNEISYDTGFVGEEDAWLSNFTDNAIEFFDQYKVQMAPQRRAYVAKRVTELPAQITDAQTKASAATGDEKAKADKRLADLKGELTDLQAEQIEFSQAKWDAMTPFQKNIHTKAFTANTGDPNYRTLTKLTYQDGDTQREMEVPKGDVLHQFREDVNTGKLPAVSWLVGPQNFSDHPSSAWFGAWYVSEALDILTQNPEVWKKTIFILNYDENDGYFDHVVPFTAPNPADPTSGKVSQGIDAGLEYINKEDDAKWRPGRSPRSHSIGLGFRVPLIVASPWSRGGMVNSEVCDLTSVLQLIETWQTHKTGKTLHEPNINEWRRTVCGDLTSIFQPYNGEKTPSPKIADRDVFLEGIHKAKFKQGVASFKGLTETEIAALTRDPYQSKLMSAQEPGTRKSSALNYELNVHGTVKNGSLELQLAASNRVFGKNALGSPFNVYEYSSHGKMKMRSYAVKAGDALTDNIALAEGTYDVRADGPNGYMRSFRGEASGDPVTVRFSYPVVKGKATGDLAVIITNPGPTKRDITIADMAYNNLNPMPSIAPGETITAIIPASKTGGWYDVEVTIDGNKTFSRRAAGRVETGKPSISDPAMGKTI